MSPCPHWKRLGEKIAALAIDVVTESPACGLSAERRDSFPKASAAFAKKLKAIGIPVIWTAYANHFAYYAQIATARREKEQKKNNGIFALPAAAQGFEPLMLKNKPDAFYDPLLHNLLQRQGVKRLIVWGMHTDACVCATIKGALVNGYDVRVPTDLLASQIEDENGGDPVWHRRALDKRLLSRKDLYRPVLSSLLLRELRAG